MLKPKVLLNTQETCQKHKAKLLVVTKTRTLEELNELYATGHLLFGENRVQELLEKYQELPKDIDWHFIGHLQRNKVKYIVPIVRMIHSIDSIKLLKEIDAQSFKQAKVMDCLVQIHVAQEESKFGIKLDQLNDFIKEYSDLKLSNVRIRGVMGMASFVADKIQVRQEFNQLHTTYKLLKDNYFKDDLGFDTLSMGMSGDFEIALEEGSTLIRVGSKLFS